MVLKCSSVISPAAINSSAFERRACRGTPFLCKLYKTYRRNDIEHGAQKNVGAAQRYTGVSPAGCLSAACPVGHRASRRRVSASAREGSPSHDRYVHSGESPPRKTDERNIHNTYIHPIRFFTVIQCMAHNLPIPPRAHRRCIASHRGIAPHSSCTPSRIASARGTRQFLCTSLQTISGSFPERVQSQATRRLLATPMKRAWPI